MKINPTLKTTLIVFFIMFSTTGFAQDAIVVSLSEAVTLAKSNNSSLKIATKEVEKQTLLKKTAFQADHLQIEYQGGQINGELYDNNFSVQQYFPIGKSTTINRKLQQELVKLAENRKALTSYEIEKAVTLAYYQYLYGVALEELNSELEIIYSAFLKNAELRYKTGESGQIEVISAKAKSMEITTEKVQIQYDLAIYQKQLQYFVQTEKTVIPDKKTPLQFQGNMGLEEAPIQNLLENYYQQQLTVYEKEVESLQAQRAPKLGLGYFAQSLDQHYYYQGFTAGLQIPLFGQNFSTKAKAAQIQVEQTKIEYDNSKWQLKLYIEELKSEFEKQQSDLVYYQNEGLKYAESIIQTAQVSYFSGDMNYWMYIGYLNQSIDIKKQYTTTLQAYNQSAIALQFPSIPKS